VLLALNQTFGIPTWLAVLAFAVYVGKDLALYPVMRGVFEPPAPAIPIGERARAVDRLAPAGLVRVHGELWKARARGGDIAPGEEVIVRAAEGLTLIVESARAR
jgi:membrane protein implicated in regulation of membrane protease activity